MKDVNGYIGIFIGGVIGFVSAFLSTFLIDFFRARRELTKWKLESAQEFFRRLYDSLAPFFSANYKLLFGMLGLAAKEIASLPEKEQQQISYNLDNVIKEIMEAYRNFIDKGYIGLFPKDLGYMMLRYNLQVDKLNTLVKENGITHEETSKMLEETMSIGENIRVRMRQLLNVDALD